MSNRMSSYVGKHGVNEILYRIDSSTTEDGTREIDERNPFGLLYDISLPSPPTEQVSSLEEPPLQTFLFLPGNHPVDPFDFDQDVLLAEGYEQLPQNDTVEELPPRGVEQFTTTKDLELFRAETPFKILSDIANLEFSSQVDLDMIIARSPEILTFFPESNQGPVPPSSGFLLSHYKEHIGKLFSPLRVRKSPWEVLHYHGAVSAHSALCLPNKTSHAKVALFYAVLSVSAYHFDNTKLRSSASGTTDLWWVLGEGFQRQAQLQLEKSCNTELDGAGKAKYKDLLMAILTMVTISVCHYSLSCGLLETSFK